MWWKSSDPYARNCAGISDAVAPPGPPSVLLCTSAFPSCWLNLDNMMSLILKPAKNMP